MASRSSATYSGTAYYPLNDVARQLNIPLTDPSDYCGVRHRAIQPGFELTSETTNETHCAPSGSSLWTCRSFRGPLAATGEGTGSKIKDSSSRHGRLQGIGGAAEIARRFGRRIAGVGTADCLRPANQDSSDAGCIRRGHDGPAGRRRAIGAYPGSAQDCSGAHFCRAVLAAPEGKEAVTG